MSGVTTVSDQLAALIEEGFPTETGSIEAIFIRPVTDERKDLQEADTHRWAEKSLVSGYGDYNKGCHKSG